MVRKEVKSDFVSVVDSIRYSQVKEIKVMLGGKRIDLLAEEGFKGSEFIRSSPCFAGPGNYLLKRIR